MNTLVAATTAAALLLLGGTIAWIRASNRRNAARAAALLTAIEDRLGDEGLVVTDQSLALGESDYRLPRHRLLEVAQRGAEDEDKAIVEGACELLREPLRPLPGSLSLKIHGPRIGIHFVRPRSLELLGTGQPRLARRPESKLGLTATYRIDGRADRCVSEAHLQEQAVDTTDLHGIALAVLRQNFDDELVARVLAGNRKIVESRDGSAAASLLILPDFLPSATRVVARLEGPNRLVLEPWTEDAPAISTTGLILEIDNRGLRIL